MDFAVHRSTFNEIYIDEAFCVYFGRPTGQDLFVCVCDTVWCIERERERERERELTGQELFVFL